MEPFPSWVESGQSVEVYHQRSNSWYNGVIHRVFDSSSKTSNSHRVQVRVWTSSNRQLEQMVSIKKDQFRAQLRRSNICYPSWINIGSTIQYYIPSPHNLWIASIVKHYNDGEFVCVSYEYQDKKWKHTIKKEQLIPHRIYSQKKRKSKAKDKKFKSRIVNDTEISAIAFDSIYYRYHSRYEILYAMNILPPEITKVIVELLPIETFLPLSPGTKRLSTRQIWPSSSV